jgi:hypothetical protein
LFVNLKEEVDMRKVTHYDKQLEIAEELGIHHPCTVEMYYDILVGSQTKATYIEIKAPPHQGSDNFEEFNVYYLTGIGGRNA